MKLSILVPMYNETEDVVKPLLDSIALQQNIDFNEIEVVIIKDGGKKILSDKFINSYPYSIKYLTKQHEGVSAARQYAFEHSNGDYVMWCDCDDMFYMNCGLWIMFKEMEIGFDSMVSIFIEETRHPETNEIMYINREQDSTFVHGKLHRRKYLINNNIRWNKNLTIHEDSFFNILCQKLSSNVKYCSTPFYLWKWRDESVCRHDPKYILKTYNNMLDSNTALVKEFLDRMKLDEARFYTTMMIYDAYYTLNKDEWINQENQEYRKAVEERFKIYYNEFKYLFNQINDDVKKQIIMGLKNRFFQEGMFLEKITFEDWIKEYEEC